MVAVSSTFSLGGDPSSIRASAQQWTAFGTAASTASSDITGLTSDEFEGDEADEYRGKVNDNLPPNLDKTSEAWTLVGTALTTYAGKLDGFQQRLSGLKTQHDNQQQSVKNAESSVNAAKSADTGEQNRVTTATSLLKPGETLPPSTYHSPTGGAQAGLTEAQSNLQGTIDAANQVHSEHRDALSACCKDIDEAKGKRFEKPPGFWDKLKNSVVDWVTEHADVLKKISGVLKVISAIAGVLSFIPILAPLMVPIALVSGGAALLIDVGVKVITGEGSWVAIGIDAVTMVLPGAGKIIGKGLKSTVTGAKVANKATRSVAGAKNALRGLPGKVGIKGNPISRVKLPRSMSKFNAKNGVSGDLGASSVNMPRVWGRTNRVNVNGTDLAVRRVPGGYRVTVRNGGATSSHALPKGTRVYHGDGTPPRTTGRAPAASARRTFSPGKNPHNGVAVGRSAEQNRMAERTVSELEDAGARNIRTDQAQVAAQGGRTTGPNTVNTNRPDVQGTVGEQRVHFEYDRASAAGDGPRAAPHAGDILTYDPSAIVLTVRGG